MIKLLSIRYVLTKFILLCFLFIFYHKYIIAQNQSFEQKNNNKLNSNRFSFLLNFPRRYATKYDNLKRIVEIKINPAKTSEFDSIKWYDNKYINRVIVNENNGEIILSFQLKNTSISWLVGYQEDPWRLIIDFWKLNEKEKSLEQNWAWNEDKFQISEPPMIIITPYVNEYKNNLPKVQNISEYPLDTLEIKNNILEVKQLPENFARIDPIIKTHLKELENIKSQILSNKFDYNNFNENIKTAKNFYNNEMYNESLELYRKIATKFQSRFSENNENLWQAGESAYLQMKFDTAQDYFNLLLNSKFKSNKKSLAQIRIIDILILKEAIIPIEISDEKKELYAGIAMSDTSSAEAKSLATLRILHNNKVNNAYSVNFYQQNLNICANLAHFPLEIKKNCLYINTRNKVEKLDALSADAEIQEYKRLYSNDARIAELEKKVTQNIAEFLKECYRNKTFDRWLEIEKKARPSLLEFSLTESELLWARAEAWNASGTNEKSALLYGVYAGMEKDHMKKNEALSIASGIYTKLNKHNKAEKLLKTLYNDENRQNKGLTERTITNLRDIAMPPYKNKQAVKILMDEFFADRYEEKDLKTLTQYLVMQRKTPIADKICDKITTFPIKTDLETNLAEKTIMLHAKDSAELSKPTRAAELYLVVSGLPSGQYRAEAAYLAGLAYVKAGLIEKAKLSWQKAATMPTNSASDKKYSVLAGEKLDRLH